MASQERDELSIIGTWWQNLMKNAQRNKDDEPNYFVASPEELETTSRIDAFITGNGENVYDSIIPAILEAQEEIVLITCFWAKSTTLDKLSTALRQLSNRVQSTGSRRIRVFIGFSSLSITQKLFHTRSLTGHAYPPSAWAKKLSLPAASDLPGLDLQIKSVFMLPFSVMHPKFVLVDRKIAILPSCNVSWESWFEGCVVLRGPIVDQFFRFWQEFWRPTNVQDHSTGHLSSYEPIHGETEQTSIAAHHKTSFDQLQEVYTIFLPSPHHVRPNFALPWQEHRSAPPTPLNTFFLTLLDAAQSSVYIQTPNLTSPPVLRSILSALDRGIDVHILTSEKLMILEQLVTAGTTTARCVKRLVKKYRRAATSLQGTHDEEQGQQSKGRLKIQYYQPLPQELRHAHEPVQSHLKLTVVDSEWVVLGSGNMDRASWYTSQELGVAFKSREFAQAVLRDVGRSMADRSRLVFSS